MPAPHTVISCLSRLMSRSLRALVSIGALLLLFWFPAEPPVPGNRPLALPMVVCSGDCRTCGCASEMVASGDCCCVLSRRLKDKKPQTVAIATSMPSDERAVPTFGRLPCGRSPALAPATAPAQPLLPVATLTPPVPRSTLPTDFVALHEQVVPRTLPPPEPPPPETFC